MNVQGHSSDGKEVEDGDIDQEFIVGKKYRVSNQIIATGKFAQIRLAEYVETGKKVAAKMSPINTLRPTLQIEFRVYMKLAYQPGFSRAFYFGKWNHYNVLIMKLLGKNLQQIFEQYNRQFSMKTILNIAIQLVDRFESIHEAGIVHRDIKPEHFLVGLNQDSRTIHVIDFSLSKPYIDPATGQHIPMKITRYLKGTIRYMSINAHQGLESSRRDDLESIGYYLIYLLRQGKLPWSGLVVVNEESDDDDDDDEPSMETETATTETKTNITRVTSIKEMYQKIYEYKLSIPIETLCYGLPIVFSNFLRYARRLGFEEEPDYEQLRQSFVDMMKREHFLDDGRFDWDSMRSNQSEGSGIPTGNGDKQPKK